MMFWAVSIRIQKTVSSTICLEFEACCESKISPSWCHPHHVSHSEFPVNTWADLYIQANVFHSPTILLWLPVLERFHNKAISTIWIHSVVMCNHSISLPPIGISTRQSNFGSKIMITSPCLRDLKILLMRWAAVLEIHQFICTTSKLLGGYPLLSSWLQSVDSYFA